MPVPMPSSIVKPTINVVQFLWKKFFPPKLGYRMAPKNLLEVIGPTTSRRKVEELLGAPHYMTEQISAYRFANALLQVQYDGDSVFVVCLASLSLRWPNRFTVFPLPFVLGKTTVQDLYEASPEDPKSLLLEFSTKFFVQWRSYYFGFPGRYFYYTFGVMEAATYPALSPPPIETEKCEDEQDTNLVRVKNPNSTRFNVVCISRAEIEAFPLDWSNFS